VKAQTLINYDDGNRTITVLSDHTAFQDTYPLKSVSIYDGLGRTSETQTYEDSSKYIAVRKNYDALGRAYQLSNPFRPSAPDNETPVWTTTAFDALGRVASLTTPDGAVAQTAYVGNAVTATDQTGKARKTVLDALGRTTAVYEDPTGLNYQTTYTYDVLDNLRTVTQGSQTRTFVYDTLKRLTSSTNPENGTASFTYDNNGNLLTRVDARSITTTLTYDVLNRPVTKTYQNDGGITPIVNFYYDGQTLPTGAPSFSRGSSTGRLVAVTYNGDSSGDYYAYDVMGRPTLKIQKTGSISYQIGVSYNNAGRVTGQTYPSNRTVSFTYDQAGRTSSFAGNLGDSVSRNYTTSITYSAFGGMKYELLSTDTPIYNKIFYNARGQAAELRASTTGTG